MGKILYYMLVLGAIASICALSLGYVNGITEGAIKLSESKNEKKLMKEVLASAEMFGMENKVVIKRVTFIPALNRVGKYAGMAAVTEVMGYGGPIKFIVGIGDNAKVSGIRIIDASKETPGLGSRILELKWQEHFKGMGIRGVFNKGVDGFAGATITPKAVFSEVKRVLVLYNTADERYADNTNGEGDE